MFKEGDYVVYKRDVCKIKEIKNINSIFYYVLNPIEDKTLTITIPHNNNLIREIINKKESEILIKSIPNIDIINTSDKLIENEYKKLLNSGKLEDLWKCNRNYLKNNNFSNTDISQIKIKLQLIGLDLNKKIY